MSTATERLNAALAGRYLIERELGEGGMATVYLARELRHERSVALKVLRPELVAVVGAARFLAEIKTTANLQHPNILPLFDSGEAGGFLFYAMPYFPGESLRDTLDREHQLSVDQAVSIAASVAEALDYAHRQGVIHRDIKPANILLQDGKPVISDFGIALAVGVAGGGRLTETGLSLGTPHYMSPEQATGDQAVQATTDIYALGCVLYEMLVGEPPYTGGTAQAILGKIIQAEPVSATKARRSVPANVDAVIRKSLEKLAADRFTTARDFAAALHDPGFRHGEPQAAGVGGGRRSALAAGVAGALLASAFTGAVVWRVASDAAGGTPAVTRFFLAVPGGGELRDNTVQAIELTRDGQTLVLNAATPESGQTLSQLFVRRLESVEVVPLRGTENVSSFFLSPDGAYVGFNDPVEGALKKIPLAGGPPTTIAATGVTSGGFPGATWGEGGTIVYSTAAYDGLMRAPDIGGTAEPLTAPEEGSGEDHISPHFLPGGESLLFVSARVGQPDQIAVLSLETGQVDTLTAGSYPQFVAPRYLVFWQDNALWAVTFDPARGALEGDPVPVVEGVASAGRGFSVSPSGTLAFAPLSEEADAPRTLVWVGRDGREQALPVEPQPYIYPRFSPDGRRLAIAVPEDVSDLNANADLWVFDLDRLARSRITFGGNNRFFPSWTPDGTRLTYADGSGNTNSVLWASADGTGRPDTLVALGDRRFPTSWSPDGRTLAYYVGPAGTPTNSRDLWMLRVDGVNRVPESYHATPFQDRAPTFSPDGRWIAYVSDKSGRDEVYAVPYPGPGPEATVSTAGGREPVWSRDGSELFYRSDDQVMTVDVALGSTFRVGTPRPLFADVYEKDASGGGIGGIPNYDVTADGERFVMVRRNASSRSPVVVVLNWVEELNRLLPDN